MLLQALRSTNEVLQTMHDYTEQQEPEIKRVLFESWNAQQEALKYGEIISVIMGGQFTFETLLSWQNDYAKLINDHIAPKWQASIDKAASQFDVKGFIFDPGSKAIDNWIQNRTSELAVNLSKSQHEAIRFVVRRMQSQGEIGDKELSADELSRFIRPLIGMVPREAEAVRKFFFAQLENGVSYEKALKKTLEYGARVHRHRAMRIARTEISFAYNYGADEAVRQAQQQSLLGSVKKQFLTAEDERVCNFCGPLDGQIIEMDSNFPGATKRLLEVLTPPLHPHCRCAVAYVED